MPYLINDFLVFHCMFGLIVNELATTTIRAVPIMLEFGAGLRFVLQWKRIFLPKLFFPMRKITLNKACATICSKGQSIFIIQYLQI